MKSECPVYRGDFVLKWPFFGRKSVRFKEGPVYECPVYRGKVNKKTFWPNKIFKNVRLREVYRVSGLRRFDCTKKILSVRYPTSAL